MHRRNMLRGALAGVGAFFAAARARAAAETAEKLKAVYHLSDLDKVTFVLGNIQNHLDGVGGPDHVTIALVVHGLALKAFHAFEATPEIGDKVGRLAKSRLQLAARGNTMWQHHEGTARHLGGFVAGICRSREGRRGADRRAAVAGIFLHPALILPR